LGQGTPFIFPFWFRLRVCPLLVGAYSSDARCRIKTNPFYVPATMPQRICGESHLPLAIVVDAHWMYLEGSTALKNLSQSLQQRNTRL